MTEKIIIAVVIIVDGECDSGGSGGVNRRQEHDSKKQKMKEEKKTTSRRWNGLQFKCIYLSNTSMHIRLVIFDFTVIASTGCGGDEVSHLFYNVFLRLKTASPCVCRCVRACVCMCEFVNGKIRPK